MSTGVLQHRALGNQATQQLLHSALIQATPAPGQSAVPLEHQSDRVRESPAFSFGSPVTHLGDSKLSVHGTGPGDTSKTPATSNTAAQPGSPNKTARSTTPEGIDIGPTDLKRVYCLKPGSFKVQTGRVPDKNFAKGTHIIEFEGLKDGKSDGKPCSCECGLYRQWISGTIEVIAPKDTAESRAQLTKEMQKKDPKKTPTDDDVRRAAEPKAKKVTDIGSCKHPLALKPNDFTEEAISCTVQSKDPCVKKFIDQPGADGALPEGLYLNIQYAFKYEIWDVCQGKSVQTQNSRLSIEGSQDPRSVIWPQSQSVSPQLHQVPSPTPSTPAPPAAAPAKPVQRSASGAVPAAGDPAIVIAALLTPGNPLDPATRSFFESQFHHDFGQVRVHTGELASQSAEAINALAYTSGQDVVFANGEFAPTTRSGQRLLAHELTHVLQQNAAGSASTAGVFSPAVRPLPAVSGSASRIFRSPDDKKTAKSSKDPACKGSPISIEAIVPKDIAPSLSPDFQTAQLGAGGAEITVPAKITFLSQLELLDATLAWDCPGGKKGKEMATHKIEWDSDQNPFTAMANSKSVTDAHSYGMHGYPGKEALNKAQKGGFDLDKCNWDYEENYNATTSAQAGSKLFHRCVWGYHYKSENQVKKGAPSKKAAVSYFGVDKSKII